LAVLNSKSTAGRAFSGQKHDILLLFGNAGGRMKYVYIPEGLDSEHFYVGITADLRARLAKHNAGEVPHTSKYGPWRLRTYIAFSDEKSARAFEKYLKSDSGRAFATKHF
jgi:putative endonuclease